ncbi:hypothetical protein PIB30_091753 [Stylosanthes scabra]|uniref:Flagellar FliJ protein n=1 Tax=Stylosanthes scabra TaxID=79078 RepID=A0ABU6XWG5_9FABA|nr:hypothetical protein [Stylosanthes scabra]
MAKEIQQVKNYQVNQTMVDSARNKAIFDKLVAVRSRQEEFFSNHANQCNIIRQEQKLLGKEILDVKKYQMNAVTMGSGSSSSPTPQRYELDQALMKIREQYANFSEMQRQLKDWTRNASARECYTVWAHQQANSNLVEMSRKMKKGSLRSKKKCLEAILWKNPTHMHGCGRICVQAKSQPRLGIPDQA